MVRKNHKVVLVIVAVTLLLSCGNNKTASVATSYLLPEGSECVEILNADSLSAPLTYQFRELYGGHTALVAFNHLTILDDTLSTPIRMPYEYDVADIHWVDGDCFFSSDSTVYFGENNGHAFPLVVSNKRIDSFSVSDSRILLPVDSLILEYRFGTETLSCLTNAHQVISHLEDAESSIFYSAGCDLYLLHDSTIYHLVAVAEEITSFVVHPNGGVFLGTKEGLIYVTPDYVMVDIVSEPVRDLSLIDDNLFAVFENNSSVMFTNVSNYDSHLSADNSGTD